MGILKSLLGGGAGGGGHPYIYDDAEIVVRNKEEEDFLGRIQGLTYGKNYEEALRLLLQFMDLHPDRRRFCLFTSATVLRACVFDQDAAPIDPCVMGDPRLDPIFMHCPRDDTVWVPKNLIKGARNVSLSGRDLSLCPKCNNKGVPGRPENLRPVEYANAFLEIKGVREHPAGSWTLGRGRRAVCAVIITKNPSREIQTKIKLDHPDIDNQTKISAYEGKPTTNRDLLAALEARWFMEDRTPYEKGLFASHGFAGAEKIEYVIMKGY
jgi:hypothetical protein